MLTFLPLRGLIYLKNEYAQSVKVWRKSAWKSWTTVSTIWTGNHWAGYYFHRKTNCYEYWWWPNSYS